MIIQTIKDAFGTECTVGDEIVFTCPVGYRTIQKSVIKSVHPKTIKADYIWSVNCKPREAQLTADKFMKVTDE